MCAIENIVENTTYYIRDFSLGQPAIYAVPCAVPTLNSTTKELHIYILELLYGSDTTIEELTIHVCNSADLYGRMVRQYI